MTEVDLRDFVSGFVAEAEEHLRTCRGALLALDRAIERGGVDPGAARELYRALHTLKGLSGMVQVEPLVHLTHHMEAVLRDADRGGGRLTSEALEALVKALGEVEARIGALGRGERVAAAPAIVLSELERVRPVGAEVPVDRGVRLLLEPELAAKLTTSERQQIVEGVRTGRRAVRLTFVPSPERARDGSTITRVRERVAARGELVRVLPVSIERSDTAPGGLAFVLLVVTDEDDAELARAAGVDVSAVATLVDVLAPRALEVAGATPPEEEPSSEARADGAIRVAVTRLERAFASLGALMVTRHRVEHAIDALAASGADVRELRHAAEEHARRVRDVRESILELRMVPVAELLQPIPLVVRGLRSSTGKSVELDMDVAHTELDKAVADAVFPALVQLVRNAVDHGIEPPAERSKRGKPETGRITLRAFERNAGRLALVVSDDGAGVDAAAIARRAGAPVPENDDDLLALITRPGVSTRSRADHTSGRGMGMDIVARRIARLGGELSLVNRPGHGSSFAIDVPLTVHIVDGLSFVCAEQQFVAPLASIDEVLDLADVTMRETPDPTGRGAMRVFEHQDEVVPYVPLDEVFGLPHRRSARAVVVRRGGRGIAFGVDRVGTLAELVVRPLESSLVRVPGVVGATDLGDGRATLVLDLPALACSLANGGGALAAHREERR